MQEETKRIKGLSFCGFHQKDAQYVNGQNDYFKQASPSYISIDLMFSPVLASTTVYIDL